MVTKTCVADIGNFIFGREKPFHDVIKIEGCLGQNTGRLVHFSYHSRALLKIDFFVNVLSQTNICLQIASNFVIIKSGVT